jgi:hypothetical protein
MDVKPKVYHFFSKNEKYTHENISIEYNTPPTPLTEVLEIGSETCIFFNSSDSSGSHV